MNVNDFCKIFGVLLVLVAYTTIAQAAIYDFDCDNGLNCSWDMNCNGDGNAIEGMHLAWESETLNFNSTTWGTHECILTVESGGYGAAGQLQTNEEADFYVNGVLFGRTSDNYGNSFNEQYCGPVEETFTGTVNLTATNTLTIDVDDSHLIISAELDCDLIGRNCASNMAPIVEEFDDELIDYTESVSYDLWDYVEDYDPEDYLSTLDFTYSQTGTSVSCTFDGRDLDCDATTTGTSTITISVTDGCNATTTESFNITVNNSAPVLRLEDQDLSCAEDLEQFIDLWDEVWDENVYSLDFNVTNQTNASDINCYVDNQHFLTCETYTCNEVSSTITVEATDEFGLTDEIDVVMSIVNQAPVWVDNMFSTCINEDTSRIYDLRDYADDSESGPDLEFSLIQSNSSLMNCYIENDYYLSCEGVSNLNGENELTITATDNRGASAADTVTISSNCFDNVIFSADNMAVCMENFTTYAKSIDLENISVEEQCYDFYTEFDIEGVEASITPDTVCVQPGEKRTITLNINAYNSQMDDYQMSVLSEEGGLEMEFDVGIGTCTNFDGFFVEEFDRTICQGQKWELPVMVRNYTDEQKGIDIEADNSYLLPYFERDTVVVDANSEKKVTLMLNAKYAPLGFYDIQLEGDAQNYHIAKNLELEVIDCSNMADRTFILEVPGVCSEVNKGDTFESYFTVKRTRDTCSNPRDPVEINFKIFGMDYELGYESKEVECFEEEIIEYAVFIDEKEEAGTHFIKIRADDGQFEEIKEVCINVLGTGDAQMLLLTSPKDVAQGTTEIFEIEVRNTGDFTEDFNLTASGMADGITVNFSEEDFTLASGERKIIYTAVTANCDEAIGDTSIIVTLNGPETLTTEIRFKVVEAQYSENLEFLSYSSELAIKANTKGEYELIIRNNTNTDLTDITVSVEGAPVDVNFEEVIIPKIKAGETYTIIGEVSVGDTNGYYTASYVVSKNNMINKQEFNIYIENEDNSGVFGGLFGLFGLEASEAMENIGLALVLIILLVGIILVVTYIRQPTVNEKWVAGELDE